jgi:hypothetical protein
MAHTIDPWDARRWYTKTVIRMARGPPEALTVGIWALRSTITDAIFIISLKRRVIAFRDPPNSSRSIANYQPCPPTNIFDRASTTPRGRRALKFLQDRITLLLQPLPTPKEQRVSDEMVREAQQRVIDDSPIFSVPRITDAPGIMESRNPTA